MATTVLHVGLPKSASSTLQRLYFSRHPDIGFLALPRKAGPPDPSGTLETFVRILREEPDLSPCRAELGTAVRQRLSELDGRVRLFSEERFTGHLGAGVAAKADLAAELFPEARIVLVVRRPFDLLLSNYFQHLRYPRPGLPVIPGPAEWLRLGLADPTPAEYYLEAVRIGRIAELYVDRFGRDRVFPMVFEAFAADPAATMTDLARFLRIDAQPFRRIAAEHPPAVNRGATRPQLMMLRHAQRLRRRFGRVAERPIMPLSRALARIPIRPAYHVPADLRSEVDAAASADCRRFAELFGLDLGPWGYPVGRGTPPSSKA